MRRATRPERRRPERARGVAWEVSWEAGEKKRMMRTRIGIGEGEGGGAMVLDPLDQASLDKRLARDARRVACEQAILQRPS